MGGHAGGREASNVSLATILEVFESSPAEVDPRDVMRESIVRANARVRTLPALDPTARPGSTIVAALVHAGGAEIAHVGDSRAYLIHAGQIFQLTRDHSRVQQLV